MSFKHTFGYFVSNSIGIKERRHQMTAATTAVVAAAVAVKKRVQGERKTHTYT